MDVDNLGNTIGDQEEVDERRRTTGKKATNSEGDKEEDVEVTKNKVVVVSQLRGIQHKQPLLAQHDATMASMGQLAITIAQEEQSRELKGTDAKIYRIIGCNITQGYVCMRTL